MKALLSAYMDGVLEESEARRVEEHLASCDACRSELIGLEELRNEVGSLTQVKAPAGFKSALMKRISDRPSKGKVFRLPRRSMINLAASFAIVALTVYLVYFAQTQHSEPLNEESVQDRNQAKEFAQSERPEKSKRGGKKGPVEDSMDAGFKGKGPEGASRLRDEVLAEAPPAVRRSELEERDNEAMSREPLPMETLVAGKGGSDRVLYVKAEGWTFPPDLLARAQSTGRVADRKARDYRSSRGKGPAGPGTPATRGGMAGEPEYEYVVIDAEAVDYDELVKALRKTEPKEIWSGTVKADDVVNVTVRLWPEEVGADDGGAHLAGEAEALKSLGYTAKREEARKRLDDPAPGRMRLEPSADPDDAKEGKKRRIVVIFPRRVEKKK
jgi:hypothetical protein